MTCAPHARYTIVHMRFSKDTAGVAIDAISVNIGTELEHSMGVLWLVSGGSAILPQCEVMSRLRSKLSEEALEKLTILPVDERYGAYDHKLSNSAQMRRAGFEPGAATWHDVLDQRFPMTETVERYTELAEAAFAEARTVIATLGMGSDAHTAGLLPASPAVTDTISTVVGYSWTDYERMTLGSRMLRQIDLADVLAYGESKRTALERLQQNGEPFGSMPAKLLYELPEVTVYNDFIESEG